MANLVGPNTPSERVQAITRQLQALIEGATAGSGTRLPSERQLAQRFQCSRNTVREALAALAAQGLVDIRGRVGAYRLAQPEVTETYFNLEHALAALSITLPGLAGLAAKPAAAGGVTRLEAVTSNLSQALLHRDLTAAYRWYVAFFKELAVTADNTYLARMLEELMAGAAQVPVLGQVRREQLETLFSGVVELLQALRRGDSHDATAIAGRSAETFAAILRTVQVATAEPSEELP